MSGLSMYDEMISSVCLGPKDDEVSRTRIDAAILLTPVGVSVEYWNKATRWHTVISCALLGDPDQKNNRHALVRGLYGCVHDFNRRLVASLNSSSTRDRSLARAAWHHVIEPRMSNEWLHGLLLCVVFDRTIFAIDNSEADRRRSYKPIVEPTKDVPQCLRKAWECYLFWDQTMDKFLDLWDKSYHDSQGDTLFPRQCALGSDASMLLRDSSAAQSLLEIGSRNGFVSTSADYEMDGADEYPGDSNVDVGVAPDQSSSLANCTSFRPAAQQTIDVALRANGHSGGNRVNIMHSLIRSVRQTHSAAKMNTIFNNFCHAALGLRALMEECGMDVPSFLRSEDGDFPVLRALYMACAVSPFCLLNGNALTSNARNRIPMYCIAQAITLPRLKPDDVRSVQERSLMNIVIEMALRGPVVFEQRMFELMTTWRNKRFQEGIASKNLPEPGRLESLPPEVGCVSPEQSVSSIHSDSGNETQSLSPEPRRGRNLEVTQKKHEMTPAMTHEEWQEIRKEAEDQNEPLVRVIRHIARVVQKKPVDVLNPEWYATALSDGTARNAKRVGNHVEIEKGNNSHVRSDRESRDSKTPQKRKHGKQLAEDRNALTPESEDSSSESTERDITPAKRRFLGSARAFGNGGNDSMVLNRTSVAAPPLYHVTSDPTGDVANTNTTICDDNEVTCMTSHHCPVRISQQNDYVAPDANSRFAAPVHDAMDESPQLPRSIDAFEDNSQPLRYLGAAIPTPDSQASRRSNGSEDPGPSNDTTEVFTQALSISHNSIDEVPEAPGHHETAGQCSDSEVLRLFGSLTEDDPIRARSSFIGLPDEEEIEIEKINGLDNRCHALSLRNVWELAPLNVGLADIPAISDPSLRSSERWLREKDVVIPSALSNGQCWRPVTVKIPVWDRQRLLIKRMLNTNFRYDLTKAPVYATIVCFTSDQWRTEDPSEVLRRRKNIHLVRCSRLADTTAFLEGAIYGFDWKKLEEIVDVNAPLTARDCTTLPISAKINQRGKRASYRMVRSSVDEYIKHWEEFVQSWDTYCASVGERSEVGSSQEALMSRDCASRDQKGRRAKSKSKKCESTTGTIIKERAVSFSIEKESQAPTLRVLSFLDIPTSEDLFPLPFDDFKPLYYRDTFAVGKESVNFRTKLSTREFGKRCVTISGLSAWSDWRIDAGGLSTFIYICKGVMVWFLPREPKQCPPWAGDKEAVDTDALILRQGDVFIMRPGTSHLVITGDFSVCFGGHFYSYAHLEDTLRALVLEHYIGFRVSNAEHRVAPLLLMKAVCSFAERLCNGTRDQLHSSASPSEVATLLVIVVHVDRLAPKLAPEPEDLPAWIGSEDFQHDYQICRNAVGPVVNGLCDFCSESGDDFNDLLERAEMLYREECESVERRLKHNEYTKMLYSCLCGRHII
ncbi:hypothetical protein ACEPAG_5782 [Sanghuangporus baumii]